MSDLLDLVLSATFLVAVVRATTPLLFATLGGLVSDLGGALNVALEGMMLIAALTAVIVSVHAPWGVAVLAGAAAGAVLGWAMGVVHLRFRADVILVGFAVNILAAGGTPFVLSLATGGDKGTSINLVSGRIPAVRLPWIEDVPVLGLLSGHSLLSWLAALAVALLWAFLYRTPWGLRLRAVGEAPAAPAAAGIRVDRVRMGSLVASGALAGLGGAQLAMFNYVGFTRDMTAGRGFIALGAVLLGARHPVGALLAALLFGVFEALAIVMPGLFPRVPAEIIQIIPFVVTVLALILFSARARDRLMRAASRIALLGRVDHPAFPPWIERRRARLGLGGGIVARAPGRIEVAVEGAPEMIDAFELACSLGPAEVWVEETRREPVGAGLGDALADRS